jgi:hypothetical protein
MIGQYLPNNNENSYSAILQKKLHVNQPWVNMPSFAKKERKEKKTLSVQKEDKKWLLERTVVQYASMLFWT